MKELRALSSTLSLLIGRKSWSKSLKKVRDQSKRFCKRFKNGPKRAKTLLNNKLIQSVLLVILNMQLRFLKLKDQNLEMEVLEKVTTPLLIISLVLLQQSSTHQSKHRSLYMKTLKFRNKMSICWKTTAKMCMPTWTLFPFPSKSGWNLAVTSHLFWKIDHKLTNKLMSW